MCHHWLRLWWNHFGAGQEFVAPVLRDGRTLLAAVPLALRTVSLFGVRITVAEIVGTGPVATRGMGLADKADLLVRADAEAHRDALAHAVANLLDRVDLLSLKGIDAASATADSFSRVTGAGRRILILKRSVSPYVALPSSWKLYLGSRSGNFNRQLRKRWRTLGQAGTIEIDRLERAAESGAWMREVIVVDQESWKAARGTNLFRHPQLRAFFLALVAALAEDHALDLRRLRLNGQIVAYNLCFDYVNRLFFYNGSYRSQCHALSPGTILTAAVLEAACAAGRTEYDMLRGAEEHKSRWCDSFRSEIEILLTSPRRVARWYAHVIAAKRRLQHQAWLSELDDRWTGLLTRYRHRR
jgi:CelD/BcsL family acetyltransferase involved in cellulose biosynthesis